jgi:hypothetical protein
MIVTAGVMPRRESAFVMGIAPLDVGGMFGEASRGATGQEFYSILYASALQTNLVTRYITFGRAFVR